MQGHQLYAVFVFLGLSLAGFQHCMVQKGNQWWQLVVIAVLLAKCLGCIDQLVKVLHP